MNVTHQFKRWIESLTTTTLCSAFYVASENVIWHATQSGASYSAQFTVPPLNNNFSWVSSSYNSFGFSHLCIIHFIDYEPTYRVVVLLSDLKKIADTDDNINWSVARLNVYACLRCSWILNYVPRNTKQYMMAFH